MLENGESFPLLYRSGQPNL